MAIARQAHILWRVLTTQLQTVELFQELKRRNVFRVGIAYLIAAWVLLQVFDVIGEILELPAWGGKLILAMLLVGFMISLIVAWAYELTPEGVKRESELDRSQLPPAQTGRKLNALIIGLLLVAVSYLLFDKFFLHSRLREVVEAPTVETEQQISSTATPETSGISDQSIAVLPFVNISANAENEYFSDGLSETLLHMLAQVPELKVAARTSSFAFKGTQTDIREIADKLNVTNVLEGSVQRAGNQVRITAQLIQASDGYHVWSQTFDRDLDNIFEVQDEIARQVTKALMGSLLTDSGDRGPDGDTRNTEAYDLYLQGREAFHANTEREASRSERLMRRAIALDPEFALAWAGLAEALRRHAVLAGLSKAEYFDEYRSAVEKAAELAPDNSQVLTTLGQLHDDSGDHGKAQEVLERAISRDPSNAAAWSQLASVHFSENRYRDAAEAATKAMNIDPLDFALKGESTYVFLALGQVDKAKALAQAVLESDPQSTTGLSALGNIYWRTGEYAAAYRVYHRLLESNPDALYVLSRLAISFMDLEDWDIAGQIFRRIESINPLFSYGWWHGDIHNWFCYVTADMECVRSRLQQRIEQSETERARLLFQWQLARFERHWEASLPMALALIERTREQEQGNYEEAVSWYGALAADRVGQLELRDELIEAVLEFWRAARAQGTDNQYPYFRMSFMHALRSDKANAVEDLEAAIDRGYRDLPAIMQLGFFDAIMEEPEVQAVLDQLRASNESELQRLHAAVEELGPVW